LWRISRIVECKTCKTISCPTHLALAGCCGQT
jgi:hypothetical protein